MISEEQLSEWQQIANEATEGPWRHGSDYDIRTLREWWNVSTWPEDTAISQTIIYNLSSKADAEFIAAAREAVPVLIAEVRKLNLIFDFVIKNSELCPPSRRNQDGCHIVEGYGWEICPKCWREEFSKVQND